MAQSHHESSIDVDSAVVGAETFLAAKARTVIRDILEVRRSAATPEGTFRITVSFESSAPQQVDIA